MSASPRADATRLALSCGPSTGLTRVERTTGTVDEAARPVAFRWDVKARDCYRVFAAAEATVEDLEVEIEAVVRGRDGRDVPHSLTNRSEPWAVAPDDGPLCAERDGTFEARFGTHAGRGEFVAFVYRGAALVPRRRPASPPGG